jgi:hypothetical protein
MGRLGQVEGGEDGLNSVEHGLSILRKVSVLRYLTPVGPKLHLGV